MPHAGIYLQLEHGRSSESYHEHSESQGNVSVTTSESRALKRHLPAAIAGDDIGVHQARVARGDSARPCRVRRLICSKAGKASRKIRRLTRALGTVRELDVTLQLLDELAPSDDLSRTAVQDVRRASWKSETAGAR